MKLRAKIVPVVCILIGLPALFAGSSAMAQMYPQPPILAPYGPTMNLGVFSLSAGVKYRDLQTVRFQLNPHTTEQIIVQGTVPFGPEQPGIVYYPYSLADGLPDPLDPDPALSGNWDYDNGYVRAANPGVNPVDPLDPTLPVDSAFGPPIRGLGWYNGSQNSAGSFRVEDPGNQVDGNTYATTTRITYSRALDGREPDYETASLGYRGLFNPSREIEFTNRILTPYFEAGYRASSFFNFMFGFSWFTVNQTYQTVLAGQGYVSRRIFLDSFFFRSTQPDPWVTGGFSSAFIANTSSENPNPIDYYFHLYPAGTGTAMNLPTRTFSTAIDPAIPAFAVEETLYNKLDFTALEFKFGGRSWYPLYGMGEIGTSAGFLWTPMPYTVTTRSTVVAAEDSPDAGVVAGQTLTQTGYYRNDVWRSNFGLFIGGDVRLGWGRWYVESNLGYDIYLTDATCGDIVENVVNLSGVNATFTAGTYF
ncbi:MAG: hypothetical protein RDU20_20055 [Desulfomonilaceae bacterium]|nr:hypothetical protein [Desulfomonilaceae bacterium]